MVEEREFNVSYVALPKTMALFSGSVLLITMIAGVWFASSIDSRVSALEGFYGDMVEVPKQVERIDKKINIIIRSIK